MHDIEFRLNEIGIMIYEKVLKIKKPTNATLLYLLMPELPIILADEAKYDYATQTILLPEKNNKLYIPGQSDDNDRIRQIVGRLIGTSMSSKEKERSNASLIQKRVASDLVEDSDKLDDLCDYHIQLISGLYADESGQIYDEFEKCINEYLDALSKKETKKAVTDENTLFPFDEFTYDELLNNIKIMWGVDDIASKSKAFTWLVLGASLRENVNRVLKKYNCSFIDKTMEILKEAESFEDEGAWEYFYEGNDLDNRFPGIVWRCDRCGSVLNEQRGFDDHLRIWKCEICGYKTVIDIDNIYDTEDDFRNGGQSVDKEKMFRALKKRTDELDSMDSME
ncbi:MAG: Sec23/Sec24 zinc finger-containing protein [Lachnospiraceae bacterium]|nr:Sec23/Sec24 zinc finger-containing protein [Lachnospiraceae bacterium]